MKDNHAVSSGSLDIIPCAMPTMFREGRAGGMQRFWVYVSHMEICDKKSSNLLAPEMNAVNAASRLDALLLILIDMDFRASTEVCHSTRGGDHLVGPLHDPSLGRLQVSIRNSDTSSAHPSISPRLSESSTRASNILHGASTPIVRSSRVQRRHQGNEIAHYRRGSGA